MIDLKFGWLAQRCTLRTSEFAVEPLGDPAGKSFRLWSPRIRDGWFYPPLDPEFLAANDIGNKHISLAPWFSLPQSHRIVLTRDSNEELAVFLIAVLGLLKGLQLVPEGSGHFYRTPIEPGTLADMTARSSACKRILTLGREYWLRFSSVRKWIFGAVHWHLFGPSYEHPFEQFGVAYSVLDTCWRIHSHVANVKGNVRHARRIVELCAAYDLALPTWATIAGDSSRLSELRNEYFHESLWGGQPVGFAHPVDVPDISLELFWFNTRLLLALLGEHSSYTMQPISGQNQLLA
jgi:hypothetical protein